MGYRLAFLTCWHCRAEIFSLRVTVFVANFHCWVPYIHHHHGAIVKYNPAASVWPPTDIPADATHKSSRNHLVGHNLLQTLAGSGNSQSDAAFSTEACQTKDGTGNTGSSTKLTLQHAAEVHIQASQGCSFNMQGCSFNCSSVVMALTPEGGQQRRRHGSRQACA